MKKFLAVKPLTRELTALYSKGRREVLRVARNPNKQELVAYGVVGGALALLVGGSAYSLIRKLRWGKRPPKRPLGMVYPTNAQRDERYGPLSFSPDPLPGNPENVILHNSPRLETVQVPQLAGIGRTSVRMFPDAAHAFRRAMRDLERDGKLGLLKTYSGAHNARLVRGSTTSLSSHSYGTSIDLNAPENPLGTGGTPEQWELAEYLIPHGFYWGGWFTRQDPHHFEWIGKPKTNSSLLV